MRKKLASRRAVHARRLIAGLLETIDTSKEALPILWMENEEGDRWVPKLDGSDDAAPEGFIYQVSRFPTQLETNYLKMTQRDEVDACDHPEKYRKQDLGIIDTMEGETCQKCGGYRSRNKGEPWPEQWDAHGSQQMMSMNQGWSEDLALALVKKGLTLSEAILVAASSCERCMNTLAHECGLDWGYPHKSEEWQKCGTSCRFCEDVRGGI